MISSKRIRRRAAWLLIPLLALSLATQPQTRSGQAQASAALIVGVPLGVMGLVVAFYGIAAALTPAQHEIRRDGATGLVLARRDDGPLGGKFLVYDERVFDGMTPKSFSVFDSEADASRYIESRKAAAAK